jgi:hypothetical protein
VKCIRFDSKIPSEETTLMCWEHHFELDLRDICCGAVKWIELVHKKREIVSHSNTFHGVRVDRSMLLVC